MNKWLAALQEDSLVFAVFVSVLQPWEKAKTVKD